MPITQDTMLKQIHESRQIYNALVRLRQGLIGYAENTIGRYPQNAELREVLQTILVTIKQTPMPDDRETYINENYYSRRAKWNTKARREQEAKRRAQGIPTMQEHLAAKRQEYVALREQQRSDPHFIEMVHPEGETSTLQSYKKPRKLPQTTDATPAEELIPTYRERKAAKGRPAPILPRDHMDDKPLEFETLQDENNSGQPTFGLDIPPDPYDNGDT